MLSAISATRLAMRFAMIAYAEVTPVPGVSPPATDAALGARGAGARGVARGLAAGVPFALGLLAPFVRWTPLIRAADGGTAAILFNYQVRLVWRVVRQTRRFGMSRELFVVGSAIGSQMQENG